MDVEDWDSGELVTLKLDPLSPPIKVRCTVGADCSSSCSMSSGQAVAAAVLMCAHRQPALTPHLWLLWRCMSEGGGACVYVCGGKQVQSVFIGDQSPNLIV